MARQDASDDTAAPAGKLAGLKSTADAPGCLPSQASQIADYDAAITYLYSRLNYEKIGHAQYSARNYRLDRMEQLLAELGDPQLEYPVIHIAGTKGKGTTALLIAEGLRASGKQVGVISSPHLLKLEERIACNDGPCSRDQMLDLTRQVAQAARRVEFLRLGKATFFELTTAMGLLHFAEQRADAVVLEVGLGGRLDSTNVCQPIITVVTSISLDHQAQLGTTIGEIASEKSGIIKPGVPVVCTAQHAEARRVVSQRASELDAPLYLIDRDFSADWKLTGDVTPAAESTNRLEPPPRAQVDYSCKSLNATEMDQTAWRTSLLGAHQRLNFAGALAVLGALNDLGWQLDIAEMQTRLATCQPMGRLEIVGQNPTRIVDTAHNAASLRAGLDSIQAHYPKRRIIVVFAASQDKDYLTMLDELTRRCSVLLLTEFRNNPRSVPADDLHASGKKAAQANGPDAAEVRVVADPPQAWRLAEQLAEAGDLIYATGSFFLAAEILAALKSD